MTAHGGATLARSSTTLTRCRLWFSQEIATAVVGVDTPDAEIAEGAALMALDVRTGSIRWRTGFELGSSDHWVVAISRGAVVVEQFMNGGGPQCLGFFDELTGERVSLMTYESEWTASVDTVSGMVIVEVDSGSAVETVGSEGDLESSVASDRGRVLLVGRHKASPRHVIDESSGRPTSVADSTLAAS
jgi:hypothetical protein